MTAVLSAAEQVTRVCEHIETVGNRTRANMMRCGTHARTEGLPDSRVAGPQCASESEERLFQNTSRHVFGGEYGVS